MSHRFLGLFPHANKPLIRIHGQRCWMGAPEYKGTSDYHIDYTNKIVHYTNFWPNEKKDVVEHLGRIGYDSRAKAGSIRKTIVRIKDQIFQLRKVIINAEMEIRYLHGYLDFLEKERKKEGMESAFKKVDYQQDVKDQLGYYWRQYVPLRDYYQELPRIQERYEKLLVAIKAKDRCFECLESRTGLKRVKHRLVCEYCREDIRMQSQNMMECPICMETHSLQESVLHGCGNKHRTCLQCYESLLTHSNRCPICRGAL